MATGKIRTLIVDDSAVVRKRVCELLAPFPEIEVVGTAIDPYVARDKILALSPDVLTLDIEMPRMDGITFLKRLMVYRPLPVIVLSSLTTEGSSKALEALQAGAVDVMSKPHGSFSAMEDGTLLAEKIKAAARVSLKNIQKTATLNAAAVAAAPAVAAAAAPKIVPAVRPAPRIERPVVQPRGSARQLILIGASTGGTEAIKSVLAALPGDLPGICIVQHIPALFSLAFANRLNELCPCEVREAKAGDIVRPGLALIAPGGFHMVVKWEVDHYRVELNEGPKIFHQRPSVDVLFDSAVKAGAGPHAIAALLTGMGADGAEGLLKLRQAGAATMAQNEETCVVFGMPREAIRLGAAQSTLALDKIPGAIERLVGRSATANPAREKSNNP